MSVQSQINAAAAGSTVTIAPGTYAEGVSISKALTLVFQPGAILKPSGWNGISVSASNVTIVGAEIVGAPGDGIEANGVHHLTVRGCKISGCGESGIQTNQCDWITIEGNECFGNALTGWFSGISLYQNKSLASGTADFRNVIRGNICRDNVSKGGYHTDGNGIIIDDFDWTQAAGTPYAFATLVEGNLCVRNGGKGIQVTWSANVTVRGNTCAGNNVDTANDGTWRSDISISQSKGARVERNIAVCKRGSGRLASNRAYGNTSTSTRFNTTTFSGNVGWDAAGTPSTQTDGGNAVSGVTWVDPKLGADWTPGIATDAGWRPVSEPEPTPEPEPEPEPVPDLTALTAIVADLGKRLAVIEGAPADYGPRIILLTEKVATLDAAVADLNARMEALSEASSTEAIANIAAGVTAVAADLIALKGALRAV